MAISTGATLALYCSHCGNIQIHHLCRFSLNIRSHVELHCSCGHLQAKISPARKSQSLLSLYCDLCRKDHVLCIDFKRADADELCKLYCIEENLELGFFGNRHLVEQTLEQDKSATNRFLPDQPGADNENSQVLLAVLNRVHDIAEFGGVYCTCGSVSIKAKVLTSSIELRCQSCGAYVTLAARSEVDLARLDAAKTIELSLSCHSRQTY